MCVAPIMILCVNLCGNCTEESEIDLIDNLPQNQLLACLICLYTRTSDNKERALMKTKMLKLSD